ncbi:MAG: hypothetical protein ACXVB0_13240 [Mucilaginibacter sp.]
MRKILLTGCLLIICSAIHAQDCTDDNLAVLPGKWISRSGWGAVQDSKADELREKPIADAVIENIRKNFPWTVIGGDITTGTFGSGDDRRAIPMRKICKSYSADVYFNPYGCNAGKTFHEESISALSIHFNRLPFDFDHSFYMSGPNATDRDTDPETDIYAILNWLPDVKDGYFDYIQDHVDGTGSNSGKIYRYRTLVKFGKLPYSVMSKKEFYEKWKIKHSIEIKSIEAKNKELAGNTLAGDLLKLNNQMKDLYQNYVDRIDGILKTKSAEELAQPAYEGEQEGEYFESLEASVYKAYIVKPNYAYYSVKVSKNSPQLITIVHVYGMGKDDDGNRTYLDEKFYKALEKMKIFDFLTERLKPLIVQ